MKKSQIEIMGFAIIVILVIIGVFLLISFKIMTQTPEKISRADESFILNFVTVFPEIDAGGCGKMSDAVQYWALGRSVPNCENPRFVVGTAANMTMERTLEQWQIPYHLIIQGRETVYYERALDCDEDTERIASEAQQISVFSGGITIDIIEVRLTRCLPR